MALVPAMARLACARRLAGLKTQPHVRPRTTPLCCSLHALAGNHGQRRGIADPTASSCIIRACRPARQEELKSSGCSRALFDLRRRLNRPIGRRGQPRAQHRRQSLCEERMRSELATVGIRRSSIPGHDSNSPCLLPVRATIPLARDICGRFAITRPGPRLFQVSRRHTARPGQSHHLGDAALAGRRSYDGRNPRRSAVRPCSPIRRRPAPAVQAMLFM